MKFQFDANQQFQLDAIAAVVDLFDGQARVEAAPVVEQLGASALVHAVPNRLDLAPEDLVRSLAVVQERSGIPPDEELRLVSEKVQGESSEHTFEFPNFTVEMETGTGKTYVYLRTALELHERYGLRKFIVVVPSVAIREGVLKALQMTEEHFGQVYANPKYRYYVYDSGDLAKVRQFALSDGVEIMVMTLASFNKDANVVRQSTDRLQGEKPLHLIQAARPVLILDEPQNMESERSRQALASLHPLFALRYSATHREFYNLVYRLTPYEAYRQGLVKRIEVAGIVQADQDNVPFVRLDEIRTQKQTVTARITLRRQMSDGTAREHQVTVRPGDCLEEHANRSDYAELMVDEISPGGGFLRFQNGLELSVGEAVGEDREAIWEAQIRYTVEEHFRKQRRLLERGIKVLSLFFIDRVDNYAPADSVLRGLFARCFEEARAEHRDVCRAVWGREDVDASEVQAAYFAQRRTKSGEIVYEDSATGEAERDREAYDLIMRDKERLLSLEEPVAFVFSHSALREGWDNPNVFQVCTLHQTVSEMRKRQEIGLT